MSLSRWYRTLKDIPTRQLVARVKFETKKRVFPKLLANLKQNPNTDQGLGFPDLRPDYLLNLIIQSEGSTIPEPKSEPYDFTFLNKTRSLRHPILWNSSDYSRLWQFNLHYFDWIREDIEVVYRQPELYSEKIQKISSCIDDWITTNPVWSYDGWHPYTTSLRIVNWTFAVRVFPALATPKILGSLWQQTCFLDRNKEFFAGGNHLLENLRALIVGGLNFDSLQAEHIVHKALNLLEKQLPIQILEDGGHYELSPMYHLIMINLVGECMVCLRSANYSVPSSIPSALKQMLRFLEAVRLKDGQYPLWNDCAYNVAPSLDATRDWIRPLCDMPAVSGPRELQTRLLESAHISSTSALAADVENSTSHLSSSGYHILRQGNLEVAFDCASPCPKELPPHAHADCLSIDVYWQGQPIIVETGTSQYGSGPIRNYERSTDAHNTIALAACAQGDETANRNFESQSEIWGSFRVGRKAQPFGQRWGQEQRWQWIQSAHDGYQRFPFQISHHRWVGVSENIVVILDYLDASQTRTQPEIRLRSHFHLAPGIQLSPTSDHHHLRGKLGKQEIYLELVGCSEQDQISVLPPQESSSWYAPEFGKRLPRSLLRMEGLLPPDNHFYGLVLSIGEPPNLTWHLQNNHLTLLLHEKGAIDCRWRKSELSTTISY